MVLSSLKKTHRFGNISHTLPKRCYSTCKGTIIKIKTCDYKTGRKAFHVCVWTAMFLLAYFIRERVDGDTTSTLRFVSGDDNSRYENALKVIKSSELCENISCVPKAQENGTLEASYAEQRSPRAFFLFLVIILLVSHNICNIMKKQICLGSPQDVTWQLVIFRQLPLKTITKTVGKLVRYQFPYPLNKIVLKLFVRCMNINMKEANDDELSNYKTILQVFTRRLRDGVRPVDTKHDIVSPADSRVMYVGDVTSNTTEQVKGVKYSLKTFVGRGVLPKCKEGHSLFSAILYLSPGDYHHFHSPVNWEVNLCRHFSGDLLTVSPWAVRCMPGLFALNERVLLSGKWKHGFYSLTAVGAMNVGSIHVKVCEQLITNKDGCDYRYTPYTDRRLHSNHNLTKGEYLGGFDMGSTVVLLFEAPNNFKFVVESGNTLKYGQPLGLIL